MLRDTNGTTIRSALVLAVAQAAVFALVYGGCLSFTASRADVGRMYSSWELRIPLVPAMIVPYFSIYALFFLAYFICRNDARELRGLSVRLTASQLVAAACYLMFPLECGFRRPPIDGAMGVMFKLLDATDRPYNLAPSLHIAQWTILLALYWRHTRGWANALTVVWFALIYVSTMLTWQHHAIDVLTGQVLGLAALYLFREREPQPTD